MTCELKRLAEEAKAAHERAVQIRRTAEFEYRSAVTEECEANKRKRVAEEHYNEVRKLEREASEAADAAFFKLAKKQVADGGNVLG